MAEKTPQNKNELANLLERYVGRGSRRVTEAQLASRIGVAQKTVSRYLLGESFPDAEKLSAIMDVIQDLSSERNNELSFEPDYSDFISEGEREFFKYFELQDQENMKSFSRLSRKKQLLLFRNCMLDRVSYMEMEFLSAFNRLNKKQQAEIIAFMSRFSLSYEQIEKYPDLFSRLCLCDTMIDELTNIDSICKRDKREPWEIDQYFCDEVMPRSEGECIQMGIAATYITKYEWYILRLFIICAMNDTPGEYYEMEGVYPCSEYPVGEMVHGLYIYIQKEAAKANGKE